MTNGDRRSGRTTRMLLAAAIAVSEGKDIIIVGHTGAYANQLAVKLWDLLVYLNIPVDPEQKIRRYSMHDQMPHDAMEVFVDHHCEEPQP